MAKKNIKRMNCEIELCSIGSSSDPTQLPISFVLHDFEYNHNRTRITKSVAKKALPSLKGKPIVCKYYEVSEPNADNDALGGHEVTISSDREGNSIITTDTIAIGCFTEDAYFDTITITNEDGEEVEKEVVMGRGILWSSRFENIVALLEEWFNSGIKITSSIEILYDSYTFKEGHTDVLNYVFEGNCLLNSEDRGIRGDDSFHPTVLPAYDVAHVTQFATFQKLVAEALQKEQASTVNDITENQKEEKNVKLFKKVFELSFSGVKAGIYEQLFQALTEDEFNRTYIEEVYNTYFIASIYTEGEGNHLYQINYTKDDTNDTIAIDMESKAEVKLKIEFVKLTSEVETTETPESSEVTETKEETSEENNAPVVSEDAEVKTEDVEVITEDAEVNTEEVDSIAKITAEKSDIEAKFNDAVEKMTTMVEQIESLKAEVESLKPFKEQAEKDAYDIAVAEKVNYYSAKFEAVKATELFNTEEIQALVKATVKEDEEGLKAKLSLSEKLVDLVQPIATTETKPVKEVASKGMNNLIPVSTSFEDRYSE